MANIHLILQGKGGVGKSVAAWALSQYLTDHAARRCRVERNASGQKKDGASTVENQTIDYQSLPEPAEAGKYLPVLIDIDPLNATLSSFRSLHVRRFNLFRKTDDPRKRFELQQEVFDEMMETIIASKTDIVIDVGSAGFAPFCSYMLENDLPLFVEKRIPGNSHRFIIHTVLVGGDNFLTTIDGFQDLARQMPMTHDVANPKTSQPLKFIVWINPYFGPVSGSGKTFEDTAAYQTYKSRIQGFVHMPDTRRSELFDKAMSACLAQRWMFREFIEAANNPDSAHKVSLMAASRMISVRDAYYANLDAMRII